MKRELTNQGDAIERLLAELGIPVDRGAGVDETPPWSDTVTDFGRQDFDERQTRILDQTMRWVGFLENQAKQLTDIASVLYQRLAESMPDLESIGAGDSGEIVERLEWTLASVECWIEEQKPSGERARFRIRWTDDDGLASWIPATTDPAVRTSLRAVVYDAAITEGEFSSDLAARIASLVVARLRAREPTLLHLRPVTAECGPEESAYELISRGEGYKGAGEDALPVEPAAMAPEVAPVSPELEAELATDDLPVAAFLDHANVAAATLAASRERAFDADLLDAIAQIADRCRLRRVDVARRLIALVQERLDTAGSGGDHEGILRLGRVISALATLVLQE
jgi:hypothetical protein